MVALGVFLNTPRKRDFPKKVVNRKDDAATHHDYAYPCGVLLSNNASTPDNTFSCTEITFIK